MLEKHFIQNKIKLEKSITLQNLVKFKTEVLFKDAHHEVI